MNLYQTIMTSLGAGAPVLLATTGEIVAERAGVVNLSLEGVMLCGALTAAACQLATGNPWIGIVAAAAVGAVAGTAHAAAVTILRLNMTATGLCLFFVLKGLSAYLGQPLASVPLIRTPTAQASTDLLSASVVAMSLGFSAAAWVLLYRTRPGLLMRAAGEDAAAARSLGLPVRAVTLIATAAGAALAAIGGAFIVLVFSRTWVEGVTGGRGWVSIGLVIVARWNPLLAVPASLLFGAIAAVQLEFQAAGVGVSPYLLSALPYLVALAVLFGAHWRARRAAMPAELSRTEEDDRNAL